MQLTKTRLLMGIGAICMLLLAACGSSSGAASKPTVTILTWEGTDTNASIDTALAQFRTAHPEINVVRLDSPSSNYGDKLSSLVQAKKLPDLFWCGNDTEQQYTSQGLLYDYSAKLNAATSGDFAKSSFVQAALTNWTTADGKIGGLPTLMNIIGVWYNADAFTAAGLPLPKVGWTWDDMLADAQKLTTTSGGTTSYGLVAPHITSISDGPFTMSQYALSAGGQPFSDNINNPKKVTIDPLYIEGVSKVAAATKAGYVAPPGFDTSNTASTFAAGKVPMFMDGQWQAPGFLSGKLPFKYGFAPLPVQAKSATLYDAVGICTPSYTANSDATWTVMQFMASNLWNTVLAKSPVAPPAYQPAGATYYSTLSGGNLSSAVDTLKDGLNTTTVSGVRFTTTWASKATDIMTPYWSDILTGKKPVSALNDMAKQLNDLIASS